MVNFVNMNGINLVTYYSSVISLCYMCNFVLISELNNIETRTYDINNAYLTACTTEKILFNAGPELHLLDIKVTCYL